jgi:predicted DNA-binding transcriptional regulator YafY
MPEKWDSAKPGEKLLSLYTVLMFSRRPLSLKELSAEINCTKQTVSRLIEQLEGSRFGKVISEKRGREMYYSLDRPKELPMISLNPDSLKELAACRNFLCHVLPDIVKKNIDSLLLQTASLVQDSRTSDFAGKLGLAFKGRIDYSEFGEMLETLMKAIAENRICQLTYQSARDGLIKEYDFGPKQLTVFHEAVYLEGWEASKSGEALFEKPTVLAVHRLRSVILLNRDGSLLPNLAPGNLFFGAVKDEPFEVKVKFSPQSAAYVSEREWSMGEQKVLHSDGTLSLTFLAVSQPEVVSWLLSFGDTAEILSPKWLRQDIRNKVKSLVRTYND